MTTQGCEQDSSGVETAAYEVLTPHGQFFLCGHHYRSNAAKSQVFSLYPAVELSAVEEIRSPAASGQYGLNRNPGS